MSIQKQVPEFKVILVGDSGVGKTSIISRATTNQFDSDLTSATIGFSFQKLFKEVANLGQVNLFIWDTAGQEMYRSMIKMYYRGIAVAVMVYDVGDRASFECLNEWLKDVREKQQHRKLNSHGEHRDCVLYYVIGNKMDIDEQDEREVAQEEGEQWIKDIKEDEDEFIDITFMEVSAKQGTNVEILFDQIAKRLLERHKAIIGSGKCNILRDPTQNISQAYNNISMSREGAGRNRIQI